MLTLTRRPGRPRTWLSDTFLRQAIELNARWRVTDDGLQWILQRRSGSETEHHSGWRDRSFCRTREGLLRCIRECCGEVYAGGLSRVEALPEMHA